jgi:hypothetical protein
MYQYRRLLHTDHVSAPVCYSKHVKSPQFVPPNIFKPIPSLYFRLLVYSLMVYLMKLLRRSVSNATICKGCRTKRSCNNFRYYNWGKSRKTSASGPRTMILRIRNTGATHMTATFGPNWFQCPFIPGTWPCRSSSG